jgi:hypothetical protein
MAPVLDASEIQEPTAFWRAKQWKLKKNREESTRPRKSLYDTARRYQTLDHTTFWQVPVSQERTPPPGFGSGLAPSLRHG